MDRFLQQTSLVIIGIALLLVLMAVREGASWIARRLIGNTHVSSEPGYVLSGVLGLLALLIAFTFSLALDRYETRTNLLVSEVSAISTADMRVRLLDQPGSGRLSALVRDYAESRVRFGNASVRDKPAAANRSAAIRKQIQAETLSAGRNVRDRPFAPLVVQAVNDMLTIGLAREAAHAAPLPTAVLRILVVYTLVAAAVLGYTLPAPKHQHRIISGLLFLLLTLALCLILDLDRARSGWIRIDQAPMERLVGTLDRAPPPALAAH